MRKLASIQRIIDIQPIEGADNILQAKVLGWTVVIGKSDNLNVGDLVVFFEVDSLLPDEDKYKFLADRCWNSKLGAYRLKTSKLRGVYSAGLILSLDKFPELFKQVAGKWYRIITP